MRQCQWLTRLLSGAALFLLPAVSQAQSNPARDSAGVPILDSLTVIGRKDDLLGIATTASQGRVEAIDLRARPLSREGELLETVPGMIVTQHSGGGKANQYFVRGFNLDHGTDFQTRIEGMPVNMPSHAHGQGYSDLNFLIPELVDYINHRLGVYYADVGDFGGAGAAEFKLVRRLPRPFVTTSAGENGLARLAAGGSSRVGGGDLLVGGEVKGYNGPWELAERMRKVSTMVRYSWQKGASQFSLLGLGYQNRWNSTDQIPLRAIDDGAVDRLGQIDSSDGGNTRRYSLSGSWRHQGENAVNEAQVYGIYSDLSLYSNFGYFLDHPVEGDQFNQRERRVVVGLNLKHVQPVEALGKSHVMRLGLQSRADFVNGLGLFLTQKRQRFATVRQDNVRETGSGVYAELESYWTPAIRSTVGLRSDLYTFNVASNLAENSGNRTAAIVSPKASIVFAPSAGTEVYLSGGFGFHSNDARGTTIRIDPATGDPARRVDPLVRSRGAELGLRVTPLTNWRSNVSVWLLNLDSELLFIGDGGATEPSAATERSGVTFSNVYRPIRQLSFDMDLSFSRAHLTGAPGNANRIPGALEQVLAAGVSWIPVRQGWFGSVRVRHFGAYPLIEDNAVRASPTTLVSAEAGLLLSSGIRLEATVLNLFNARDYDIQYYYASRLQGEAAGGVDDIHVHPVEPRQIRVALMYGL